MANTKLRYQILLTTAVWFCAAWLSPVTLRGQDDLLEAEPYDELLLNGETKSLKLVPIEMKQRRPLAELKLKADDDIVVRLLEKPDRPYKVKWSEVSSVRLFEEMLLDRASRQVEMGQFDLAVEYYLLLERKFPTFPGVAEGYQKCLFTEAGFWARKAKFEQSFVLLNELYRRNNQYAGISRALDVTVDKIVEQRIAAGQFEAARLLLDEQEKKFADSEVVKSRRQEIIKLAEQSLTDAKQALADGQMRNAYLLTTEAMKRWPNLAGGAETLKAINEKYPIVIVGVEQDKITTGDPLFGDWVARRQRRLTTRLVAEATGFQSPSGATYQLPFVFVDSNDQETKLSLREGLQWNDGRAVAADDLATLLVSQEPGLSIKPLSGIGSGLEITQPDARTICLQIAGLPAGFSGRLQAELQPWDASAGAEAGIFAPYARVVSEAGGTSFVANQKYFALQPAQPLEVIEQRFGSAGTAIRGLRQGDFAAIDRILSWDLDKFMAQTDLEVLPYAAPTVCLLVVNPHSQVFSNLSRRRAIAFGVNRQRIVASVLFPEGEAHAKLISGPFPHGYAYDDRVAEVEYDPRQFLLMLQVANDALASEKTPSNAKPEITIAFPASQIGRRVCGEIQKHLQLGANVRLRELTDRFDFANDPDWDLLYVEAYAMDPVVDAFRLFGAGSLTGMTSPFLQSLLDRLSAARDLEAAGIILKELHAHVQAQQLVIPLWELTEFFAKSKNLQGCANERISFYQDVEQWRYLRN